MFKKNKIFILSFLLFLSCKNEGVIFLEYSNLNGTWDKENEINFSFDAEENFADLSLLIRNDNSYPFSNIYLITSIKNNNEIIIDTINYLFENNNTNWYNLESSSINNSKISLKDNFKILAGELDFKVKHSVRYLDSIMPQKKLDGILDVGLLVEKTLK
jgi:gliding motility-associated lipoprotein GldH